MTKYIHNKCDICGKQLPTALGFHRHYVQCLAKKYNAKSVLL